LVGKPEEKTLSGRTTCFAKRWLRNKFDRP